MKISFQKLFYAIATVFAIFSILVLAKSILIPLSVALLMSFILYPLAKRFESWGINQILAASLSIFTVVLILGGIIFLFSTQILKLSTEFSHFQDKILLTFANATQYINEHVPFIQDFGKNDLINQIKNWISESTGTLVSKSISGTTSFIAGLVMSIIFTFLILIYRKGLTNAFARFSPEDKRERVIKMFKSIQQVGKKYLLGMSFLIIVIGLANSIGLWIIGIDNPFLFGYLGATLSIIPYIGTVFGAIIPVLYAFLIFSSPWAAIAVAILFWAVQAISDNFLTPKIVGSSLEINALTSILSLIVGGAVWGVAGMILFLPFAAMFRVVCEEYDELKPIALLIGNQNYNEKDSGSSFLAKWFKKLKGEDSSSKSTSKSKIKSKQTIEKP